MSITVVSLSPLPPGVQLMSVTKLSESPPVAPYPPMVGKGTQNPEEASLKYVRVSDQSDVENDPNLLNMFPPPRGMKSSKSSDSLLSLGDVELGVDCVTGEGVPSVEGIDEVDSPLLSDAGERPTPKVTICTIATPEKLTAI